MTRRSPPGRPPPRRRRRTRGGTCSRRRAGGRRQSRRPSRGGCGAAVGGEDQKKGKKIIKRDFEKGDKVRIREGAFANMEGEVKEITEPKEAGDTPKVTVEVMIFGRGVPVDLEYWQVDKA